MSMIKLMHVIGSMDLGGAEKLTKQTIEGLNRNEFAASVCCLKAGGYYAKELAQKNYPVWVLLNVQKHAKNGPLGLIKVAWHLFWLLRREKPHIVHSHLFLASFLVRTVGWLAGTQCHVVTMHRIEYPRIQPFIERLLARITTRYVTDSKAAAGLISGKLGVDKKKIEVIYNGIDTSQFEAPPSKNVARRSLNVSGDDFIIGIVAHLFEEKGHTFLFDSLASIRHTLGRFKLLVVGDGYLRPGLEKQATAQFEEGQIVFLGQRGDLANLLSAMDILVLPSSWEGFGIILAEAMYMQIPVITTSDGGGCSEVVEEGDGGALVPFGDHKALAGAVLKFRADAQLRTAQGIKGRARVEKYFVSKDMDHRYAEMYRQVNCAQDGK